MRDVLQASEAQLREEMARKVSGGVTIFEYERAVITHSSLCMCFRAECIHALCEGHFCVMVSIHVLCVYMYIKALLWFTCELQIAYIPDLALHL